MTDVPSTGEHACHCQGLSRQFFVGTRVIVRSYTDNDTHATRESSASYRARIRLLEVVMFRTRTWVRTPRGARREVRRRRAAHAQKDEQHEKQP